MKLFNAIQLLIIVQNHKYKMKYYSLKCRKDTASINPRVSNTCNCTTMVLSKCAICDSNGKRMILSKCAICGSKKSRFIKNEEAKGLLSNLGLKASLSTVPLSGDIFFF